MPRRPSRKARAYPPELRRHLLEPLRAGRPPEELAREFELSGQTRFSNGPSGPRSGEGRCATYCWGVTGGIRLWKVPS
jgi:hypothetical protein